MSVPRDIILKAEEVTDYDGFKRWVVLSEETYPHNGKRVPAIRLGGLRAGDELVHETDGDVYNAVTARGRRVAGGVAPAMHELTVDARCENCGSDDLCFGVDERDNEDGTYVCENCEHEGRV